MTMPTFVLIGPPKCGTTSLYHYLRQHPQVFMSPDKEPHFFAFEGQEVAFRGPGTPMNEMAVTDLERYRELFADAGDALAIGEASTFYLYVPEAAANLHRHLPDARLIAMLRNPVERAYSAYMHKRRDGREPEHDFLAALEAEEARIADGWAPLYHYRHTGYYATQVRRYLDTFPREQVKILLYDDFRRDPAATLREIYTFLGVDPDFETDTAERHNVSGVHRNPLARALFLFQRDARTQRVAKALVPRSLRRAIKEGMILPWHRRSLDKPPLPDDARRYLIEAYRDDVAALEDLLGRDLSAWLARDAAP
jgi:hypothetical protein